MKQTAIQQAIAMVRSRMESMDETLMGKHTAHHLQQVERLLYELLDVERQQIMDAFVSGEHQQGFEDEAEQYYNENCKKDA